MVCIIEESFVGGIRISTIFGLDLDFFNYRLGIVLDYYYRYTDDLLACRSGYRGSPNGVHWHSGGMLRAISNEGFEVDGEVLILFNRQDLYWRVSANWGEKLEPFRASRMSGLDVSGNGLSGNL